MTVLGKILVFVNLVFSLITGALIVMVFVTRTNWKAGYEDLTKRYGVQQATIQSFSEQLGARTKDLEASDAKLNAAEAMAKREHDNLTNQLTAETTLKQQAVSRAQAAETSLEAAVAEKERRQREVEALKLVNADKERKLADMERENKTFRDRAVDAEINYKAALERNGLLQDQLVKVEKENRQLRNSQPAGAGGVSIAQGKQPPPEDLKGSILEVDPKAGLLTVSLGTDSGLKVGNTLEVYHLAPKPEYLGTVRIVDANFKYAVARPVAPLQAAQLNKGDTVASRIIAR
jgi:hypothetical protein